MVGVLANSFAIVCGAFIGLIFRRFMNPQVSLRIEQALGFCSLALGVKMAMKFENILLPILCVGLGGVLGTWLQVEERTTQLAGWLKVRIFGKTEGDEGFIEGFSMSSILFCTGAMAVLGSINSGVGDHQVLFAKSLVDGLLNISFAAIYGIGVAFSAIPVLIYQGTIAVLASRLTFLSEPHLLNELSAVGGILLMMIGTNLSGLKKIPVGDYLPALALAMLLAQYF